MLFFPAPYPDELFYSVLCRYHMRCGVPPAGTTNREIGGYKIGMNIYLPQVGRLSPQIPPKTGLTPDRFLNETTIFPYVKPLLPAERGQRAAEIFKSSEPHDQVHNATGFSRLELPKWKYLRYCDECWRDDLRVYGEAYWHRLHILPGVLVCPVHSVPITNSKVLIANITREFHPASFTLATQGTSPTIYSGQLMRQLASLAGDSAWLLQNGHALMSLEDTLERYIILLTAKGFVNLSRTKAKSGELDDEIRNFYGDSFLDTLEIDSYEHIPWSRKLFYRKNSLSNPLWHLLLMRFLAGSAEAFFTEAHQKLSPYGAGPWPCRNPICEHYLKDVILEIDERYEFSRFKAVFKCPYCGFTYNRSNGGQPECMNPQTVRIRITDYGWLWRSMMMGRLKSGVPVMRIMELMHCGYRTVMTFGAESGFFTQERVPKKYFYGREQDKKPERPSTVNLREVYRKQWTTAISDDPFVSRSALMRRFPQAYHWLRKNDLEWYETNSPKSQKSQHNWSEKDSKYLRQVTDAFASMMEKPGKPIWITIRAMERYSGITNLYDLLKKGKSPLTQAFLDAHIESRTDWNKRKIRWAVEGIYKSGNQPHMSSVRLMTGITPKVFECLRDYFDEYVNQLTYSDDS